MKLYEITREHQQALDLLSEMEDLDPQIIEDSMAALNDQLEAKVLSCAKYLKGLEAEARAIREAEQNMAARRKALENAAASFKDYLRHNMTRAELQKAKDAEISISLTKPREVCVLDDEALIPDEFVKIERKPVKAEIQKALKNGEQIAGAHLELGQPGLRIS